MKIPSFILAGSPKCGSTSLYYYLAEHPDIFMSQQKEIHYLTFDILNSLNQGPKDKVVNSFHISNFKDYKNQFTKARNNQVIGEVSPSYINYPSQTIPKIKHHLGNPKLIFLIRDPIQRAFSNYLHLVREEREDLSFYDALQAEQERMKNKYSDFWYYSFNSFYYEKIKAYDEAFDDILIITAEELKNNTLRTLSKIFKFIGVNDFAPSNLDKSYNAGGVYESNLITQFFFRQSALRSFIKRVIPITKGMKHFKQSLINKYRKEPPAITQETEKYLVNKFKEDVSKLQKEYDLDLEYWNKSLTNDDE